MFLCQLVFGSLTFLSLFLFVCLMNYVCCRCMNFSENYSYINPYIGGSNKEPPKDPWGLLASTGRRLFGDLFFPLMPLDVIRPNTSCSWLSLQEESVSICLIFDPLKWLIGAHRLCILIAHSERLVPRLMPRCFEEKHNVLRSVRHQDPGGGGRGAYCLSVVPQTGAKRSVSARNDQRSVESTRPTNPS